MDFLFPFMHIFLEKEWRNPMMSTRKDAWTEEEDILLANIVIQYIKDGSTQLKAFEEVGKQLSRTGSACGFRWNSYTRKQYKSDIQSAKVFRKQRLVISNEEKELPESRSSKDFEQILGFIKDIYDKSKKYEDQNGLSEKIKNSFL
ncbi:Myb-like DNA-binding domain-containing protein [Streptomyces sp. NPDC057131]|uniref:Myb-like DNA-binding domain-containing protein n=1 Tax=Streptomyces sp. NPDC057131 TaxID=3346027 RepID=UPI00362EFF98